MKSAKQCVLIIFWLHVSLQLCLLGVVRLTATKEVLLGLLRLLCRVLLRPRISLAVNSLVFSFVTSTI